MLAALHLFKCKLAPFLLKPLHVSSLGMKHSPCLRSSSASPNFSLLTPHPSVLVPLSPPQRSFSRTPYGNRSVFRCSICFMIIFFHILCVVHHCILTYSCLPHFLYFSSPHPHHTVSPLRAWNTPSPSITLNTQKMFKKVLIDGSSRPKDWDWANFSSPFLTYYPPVMLSLYSNGFLTNFEGNLKR